MLKALVSWGLGPLAALVVWMAPLELGAQAHTLAALMCWVVGWWIFEPVALPATGLFGVSLAVVLGITDAKTAFAPYAHPLVFLFMGGFFIAKAMTVHGLDRRIALGLLTAPGVLGHPRRTLLALIGVSFFLSMWINNTATTAMLLPIALGILGTLVPGDSPKDRINQSVILLAVAYASSIGGTATPVGSTPNIIVLAQLAETQGLTFTFLEWMAMALPISLGCLGFLMFLTHWRLSDLPAGSDTRFLLKERSQLGPLSVGERSTVFAALLAVVLWVGPGIFAVFLGKEHELYLMFRKHLPEANTAILCSSLLFILRDGRGGPTLTWERAATIDWRSLILFGGGLSLGKMMFATGLAQAVGDGILELSGASPVVFLAVAVVFAIFFTETTSNTATANMLIPMILAASVSLGIEPQWPAIGVAMACSLAFMMPVSTPPNAIVYGSGVIPIPLMIRKGFALNLACAVIVFTVIWFHGGTG